MQEAGSDRSRRTIYIDIEALKTEPPHVAILGVLSGDTGESIEQLIVDPRLAPARVAKRDRLRVVEFTTAVRELVRRAADDDVPMIGWSEFDRDRLIETCPDLAPAIAGRYVNALTRTPERSLIILDISHGKAVSLARRFGQLAIVAGRRGEASRLVATSGASSQDA